VLLATVQEQAIEELRTSRLETVERLAKAVELRDAATGGHVGRIGDISALLAEKLGFDADRVELMRSAAPMHDVGKIGISDEILLKPGSLTNDERRAMKRHATIGHDLLADSQSELLRLAATIARTHHEHFDGSGYPSGLVGEEIPLEGRIVAVADVFDALLSTRSYRPALALSEALEIMRSGRGSHFDPAIVDVLLDALDDFLAIRAAPEVAALASEAG
jgi:HD-GYP domain-containing protein (c-di-GMP phosphodiesterase class II)